MNKKRFKLFANQKGMTLTELLAVIVILGIIAAIAIPSVNSIVSNTRKNTHIENARQLVSAAMRKVYNESINESKTFTLNELKDEKYIERISDPSNAENESYHETNSKVQVQKVDDNFTYSVCLAEAGSSKYYLGDGSSCIKESQFKVDDIVKNY